MIKLKTLKEVLADQKVDEMAQAKKGNWKDSSEMLGELSYSNIEEMEDYWKFIDKLDDNLVLQNKELKNMNYFIVGNFIEVEIPTKNGIENKTKFQINFAIALHPLKKSSVYGQLYNVSGVASKVKKSGFGLKMYKYFVKTLKYTILGDSEQYFGARKLWARLSKELDVIVDIYDIKDDKILEENVILHHGNYNNDFDKRLWSFSKDKNNIRSILKDLI